MSRRTRTPAPPATDDVADMLGDVSAAQAPAASLSGIVRVRNLFADAIWLSSGRLEPGEVAEASAAEAEILRARGLAEVVP